jgi:predicted transglutaminase-like cysteine proteinase
MKVFKTEHKIALLMSFFVFISLVFIGCASNNKDYYKTKLINKTPYDDRYVRVEKHLRNIPEKASNKQNKKLIVEKHLKKASKFIYEADKQQDESVGAVFTDYQKVKYDHWKLPNETELTNRGDCEDKAIWLYSKLIDEGFKDVKLVTGKHRESDNNFHAWVTWHHENKIYILDPTINKGLYQVNHYPSGYYKPHYFYHRDKKWCGVVACVIEPAPSSKQARKG